MAHNMLHRLPAKREILLVFALCFTLVYTWSSLMFFNFLPSWIMYLRAWSIAGIFAYSQIFAVFESLLFLFLLLLLAFILPARFLREQFVSKGAVLVVLAAALAVTAHITSVVPLWPSKKLIAAILIYLAAAGISIYLLQRNKRLAGLVEKFVDRLSVLLVLYLPFVAISGIILILRNFVGVR